MCGPLIALSLVILAARRNPEFARESASSSQSATQNELATNQSSRALPQCISKKAQKQGSMLSGQCYQFSSGFVRW
ncbi:hypothetical protein BRAO375_1590019 [Bradyrhizobium sp. ORS 375]|nr:hypothetical protein BRAO375_1590019 [Bradyrhizobium sp. ORS 375]